MVTCASCSANNSESSKFCSECGAALSPEIAATLPPHDHAVAAESSVDSSPTDSSHHGRYLPGTKVAQRYRIVSLVGTGGMGEVYRADDLKLGHTVALKFLPKDFTQDPQRLDYFHSEVRLTRQISHPHVCRVYDIGEVDAQHFLSMEYIDGEDLKGLLRRIGRLASHKGIEIAQQLCAGLAAAHDRGVIHRDLKPANIMIDGRGQVRITDFGLAKLSADSREGDQAGTPVYMAPEQLARGETTIQSDLYALGLVLYELFTGEAVHKSSSIVQLLQDHQDSSLTQPSSLVDDMDPAVERVILKCLEKEPHERPKSATAVAASLPGGDPLAAVLAAGETPSPEMVAAAGESVVISPAVGGAYLAGIVALLFVACLLADKVCLVNRSPLERSTDSLRDEAKEIIAQLGIDEPIGDSASGFDIRQSDLAMVETTELPIGVTDRWELLKTGPWPGWRFWYRQSPAQMSVNEFSGDGFFRSSRTRITPWSPSWNVPGMAGAWLSPQGELRRFRVVPPRTPTEDPTQTPMDIEKWREWFPERVIGFDLADLTLAEWQYTPPDAYDQCQTWEGTWPGRTDKVSVVAAAYRGRPVYFQVLHPVIPTYAGTHAAEVPSRRELLLYIIIGVQVGAVALAWWNLRLGRGDRRGAFRLTVFIFVANMLIWVLAASHVKGLLEVEILYIGVAQGLLPAGIYWLLYIALEPFVRRLWPESLISWTRVLDGRWRDPRIGRDLLVGVFVGTMGAVVSHSSVFISISFGLATELEWSPPRSLLGTMDLIAEAVQLPILPVSGIGASLGILTMLVLLRIVLRYERLAAIVALFLFAAAYSRLIPVPVYVAWLPAGLYLGAVILLLTRFGLFAVVTTFVTTDLLRFPITTDSSAFYFGNGLFAIVLVLALAVYGLYTALGNPAVTGARRLI